LPRPSTGKISKKGPKKNAMERPRGSRTPTHCLVRDRLIQQHLRGRRDWKPNCTQDRLTRIELGHGKTLLERVVDEEPANTDKKPKIKRHNPLEQWEPTSSSIRKGKTKDSERQESKADRRAAS